MTSTSPKQQAMQWYLKVSDDAMSSSELFLFNEWLQEPANAAAYDQFEQLDCCFASLQQNHEGELLMRHSHAHSPKKQRPQWLWPTRWLWGIPSAAMSVALCAYFFIASAPAVIDYSTATGEIRTITLAEGSELTLTPETQVTVTFSKQLRSVVQHKGHALFDVAKDINRPFIVEAGNFSVEVTGTEFSVNTKRETLQVKVSEGQVKVSESSKQQQVELSAGTEVSAINSDTLGLRKTSTQDELSQWKQGILVYRDTPLQVILGEVNSYTRHNLHVNSASLGETRISLSINLDDLDTLPDLLEQLLPVMAIPDSYGKIVLLETP